MRRVLKNHDEVCHYWANQVQSEGRAARMFFHGPNIYSHGTHFCIARILPSGTVVFTLSDYSVSTRTHKSKAQRACRHRTTVYCKDPDASAGRNMQWARNEVASALADAKKPRIHTKTRVAHRARALDIAQEANAYLMALPEDERENQTPIGLEELENVVVELEAIRKAEAIAQVERQRERVRELADDLVLWRSGSLSVRTGLWEIPAALRLADQDRVVQTSHGAEIPVEDALKLWPLIQRVLRGDKDYTPGMPIGHYRLTQIRRNGSITVGCHDIAYSEIERIAVVLGLLQKEAA